MILLLALISATGVLFLVFKFGNVRRVLWFDKYIDLISTVGLAIAFMGTLGGMAIAVIAGTFISITLWIMRKAIGCEELTVKGWEKGNPGFLNGEKKCKQDISYLRWRFQSSQSRPST